MAVFPEQAVFPETGRLFLRHGLPVSDRVLPGVDSKA